MTDKQPPEWMGKNRKLTPMEIKEFLAEPVVARVATIDENGVPYVTPVVAGMGRRSVLDRTARALGLGRAYQEESECWHFVRAGQRNLHAHHGAGEG